MGQKTPSCSCERTPLVVNWQVLASILVRPVSQAMVRMGADVIHPLSSSNTIWHLSFHVNTASFFVRSWRGLAIRENPLMNLQ